VLQRRLALGIVLAGLGLIPAACVAQTTGDTSGGQLANAGEAPQIDSPLAAYLAGLSATRHHDLSIAADYMLTALEGDPDNPELLREAFLLVAGEGRHAEAEDLAARIIAIDPDHLMANLVLTVADIDAGRWEDADARLKALPQHGLGSLVGPLVGAWIAAGQEDFEAARLSLEPIATDSGIEFLHHVHLGLISEVGGDPEAAAAAYEKAFQTSGRPNLRLAWIVGSFYERRGEPERALEIYRQFVEEGRGVSLVEPLIARAEEGGTVVAPVPDAAAGVAEVFFNFASLLDQEQAQDLALVTLQMTLRLTPDFTMARVLLGEILQQQDRGKAAIATYRSIPADSPFAWLVRLRIAEELDRLDEVDLALAELDGLASERPDQFEPYFRKGNLLRAHERFEEAVVAYDQAFERVGEIEQRHWSLLYFRGVALERSKQWDRAEADFLKALELEPEQPFVMNYLAYSWVEQKRNLDESKRMLARAVELRPDDGFIVDSLGWVFFRLGEYDNAVRYLERAVELQPQDPVINDHLGDAFWRTGRRAEARFQWRRALSLEPEDDEVPKIKQKIKQGLEEEAKDS
jgi:tetratricopeptide (TPR) repeat protein